MTATPISRPMPVPHFSKRHHQDGLDLALAFFLLARFFVEVVLRVAFFFAVVLEVRCAPMSVLCSYC